jgi:hypothetical protein
MLSGWVVATHEETLRLRIYRTPKSDHLVVCGQYYAHRRVLILIKISLLNDVHSFCEV